MKQVTSRDRNCFIVLLTVYGIEVISEIRVSGSWPVDKIGYIIGMRRHIGAIFLPACRKKAE
jgi:hypothetical protein